MPDSSAFFRHPFKGSGGQLLNLQQGDAFPASLQPTAHSLAMKHATSQSSVSHLPSAGDEGIDEELWYACAGPYKTLPPVNSEVAYLPQGHIEQVASFNNQDVDGQIPRYNLPAIIPCTLNDIQLSADPETDEVFATLTLCPLIEPVGDSSGNVEPLVLPKRKSNSFTKTLTVSDTSTHGGFSVPRRAAEECLPPLDKSQDPPTQELVAKDLHGNEWKFRHIFRGQPKRHLLTTGWSVFVSQKRLVAGDAVLFLRGENGQLRVGVRRAPRQQQKSKVLTSPTMTLGVLAAAAHAASEKSRFSLIYNPRSCPSEFVIPLRKHFNAVKSNFTVGQRFKMKFESEDSSDRRCTGTITGISDYDPGRWPGSAWRSLQVNWDDSSSCERQERLSPWDIGPFTGCTTIPPQVGTRKRVRHSANARADHSLGTSRVGAESPHSQTSRLPASLHGCHEDRSTPSSTGEEADADGAVPSHMSFNVKREDGFNVENRLGSNKLGADRWLQMRKSDVLQGNDLLRGLTGAGLQDCQSVMGRSKPEQRNFCVQQLYSEHEDSGADLGIGLHLSSSGVSNFRSFVKPQIFSDADLQLCVSSPTPSDQTGTKLSNLLLPTANCSQPPSPRVPFCVNGWLPSFKPRLEVVGSSAAPNTPDGTGLSMGSFPTLDSGSSSHPSNPKSNFWEKWKEPDSDHPRIPAPPQSEQQCKIFGVPLDKPAPVTISSQTSGSKELSSLDDEANHTSNRCVEKIGSSLSPGNILSTSVGGPELEMAGQRCKGAQNWPQAPVRSFTKVHKHGAIGRSIDVTKFDGYGELLKEVEEMFGLEGELFDKKSGWQLVYTDHEEDVLLVGDDPWVEFCSCVRSIRVLSPGEVSPTGRSIGSHFADKEKSNQSEGGAGKDT